MNAQPSTPVLLIAMIPNLHEDNQFFDCSRGGKNIQSSPTDGSEPVNLQFSVISPPFFRSIGQHLIDIRWK